MFYYTYILRSIKNKSLYIGYTTNVRRRLEKHNLGENKSTKPFRPYEPIFFEAFTNRKDAKAREKFLKSGWGRRSIKKLLENYLGES